MSGEGISDRPEIEQPGEERLAEGRKKPPQPAEEKGEVVAGGGELKGEDVR